MHYTTRYAPERVRSQWVEEFGRGLSVSQISQMHQVARSTVQRWLHREVMSSRSSRPHHQPGKLDPALEQQVLTIRRQTRWGPWRIGQQLGMPASTVYKVLHRHGINRLASLETLPPVQRYEWRRSGELMHVDVKKLGLRGLVHARHQYTRQMASQHLHVMLDDHSRVVYARIYPDESADSATEFLERGVAWFASLGVLAQRVLTDNGSAYTSVRWRDVCQLLGIRHLRTRPYRPQTNGKCERWNRTLIEEAIPGRLLPSLEARAAVIENFVHHYNSHRAHTALKGKMPLQRLLKL